MGFQFALVCLAALPMFTASSAPPSAVEVWSDAGGSASKKVKLNSRPTQLATDTTETMTVEGAVQWLSDHMRHPLPNGNADDAYMRLNADTALRARNELSVAGQVPMNLFLQEVLPPVHVDEPLNQWRPLFYEKLKPVVEGASTLMEVANRVIPRVWDGTLGKKLEFRGDNTPQVMAPVTETLAKGYASCTGMSILAANALRSVGVPARIVGTSKWNVPTGGNHNWVEAWLGDKWHFFDAVPSDKVEWDKAWFLSENAKKAVPGGVHGIYTPVWDEKSADSTYSLTWRDPAVELPARDRTNDYLVMSQAVEA